MYPIPIWRLAVATCKAHVYHQCHMYVVQIAIAMHVAIKKYITMHVLKVCGRFLRGRQLLGSGLYLLAILLQQTWKFLATCQNPIQIVNIGWNVVTLRLRLGVRKEREGMEWNGIITRKWKGMEWNGMYLSKGNEWKRME